MAWGGVSQVVEPQDRGAGWGGGERESARERERESERTKGESVERCARRRRRRPSVLVFDGAMGTPELPSSVQGEGEAKRRNEAEEVQVVW